MPQEPPLARDLPRVGALATVRNRRGVIASVDAYSSHEGEVHLVGLEYLDADGPLADLLVWEREPPYGREVIEPTALPPVTDSDPMPDRHFDALVRATRWGAVRPFVDPDGSGPLEGLPLAAPFYGAIQIEDFQLVPLVESLRMPRVTLLLADDVGLGKTIEAGLIMAELIQRRRIRRVLILCPASLRRQWQQEMWDKFAIDFEVVDRSATDALRRRLGMDANPWRSFPHVIASYDYLKQPDVLEEFRAASRGNGTALLPWDLLIVDEVHNLAPAAIGQDSEVSRMLQHVTPLFEHRLFLSATPHNGHTRCFTGLLECLDPSRFTRATTFGDRARARAQEVVVRRLKREINERRSQRGERRPFGERRVEPVMLRLGPAERALSEAFDALRKRLRALVRGGAAGQRTAGSFAVEVLQKRLLSCPIAFADSWRRCRLGMEQEDARAEEVAAAGRAAREELASDSEIESRVGHAATVVGAWLKPWVGQMSDELAAVDRALSALGLGSEDGGAADPGEDARFDAVIALIDRRLRNGNRFHGDERLVIFTEFKTTLEALERRLRARYPEAGAVRVLHGDMGEDEREEIRHAFNDPADPVRVLVATDAASEGLNLQETARLLIHYDVPWNPARLEQRNGRLDRHGQARDVTVYHFATDDDADLDFLAYVVGKVHRVREDLGSTGEVFDTALERRLIAGEDTASLKAEVDRNLEAATGHADFPRNADDGGAEQARLRALAAELDLDPDTLRETLDLALGLGRPSLEGPDARGYFRLRGELPAMWKVLADETLRHPAKGSILGAMRALVFDPACFVRPLGEREVFRPAPDAVLLHLGHPLFHQALSWYARARFPGAAAGVSRWTVTRAGVPKGVDALVLLTIEEMAVNDLRETFHHWVRTVRFEVKGGVVKPPLPHLPARELGPDARAAKPGDDRRARELWIEVEPELRSWLSREAADRTARLESALRAEAEEQRRREVERFEQRQGEISALIESTTSQKLLEEIRRLKAEMAQGRLFDPEDRLAMERRADQLEEEVRHRRQHYESLRQHLAAERVRVLERLLPRRFALRDRARVFPVAVEIRLPEGAA